MPESAPGAGRSGQFFCRQPVLRHFQAECGGGAGGRTVLPEVRAYAAVSVACAESGGSMPFPVEIDSTTNMTVAPVFAGDRRHHGVLR